LKEHNKHKLKTKNFGLCWNEASKCWRLLLGNEQRRNEDPFLLEHFTVPQYGTKSAAKEAAMERRDKAMSSKAFRGYYHYQVNGRRVKRPQKTSSIRITGLVFVKGQQLRNGILRTSPSIRVYIGPKIIGSFPLKSLGCRTAFVDAVRCRYAEEKRRFIRKEAEAAAENWLEQKEIKKFMKENEVPIFL
jgi:hypothetical protein